MNHKGIPIIFIHHGISWYLEHVLKCAVFTNPGTDVYLVGDDENRNVAKSTGANFIHLDDTIPPDDDIEMQKWWGAFANGRYEHVGSAYKQGTVYDHLFCIWRWFRLYRIMGMIGAPHTWYFDSDTIIARRLSEIEDQLIGRQCINTKIKAYLSNWISGCASLWVQKDALREVCETAYGLYTDPGFMARQREIFALEEAKGKGYNFCDMTAMREWRASGSNKLLTIGELSYPMEYIEDEWSMFDPNINLATSDQVPSYFMRFKMAGKSKEIIWKRDMPYFTEVNTGMVVRANTLNMSWYCERQGQFMDAIDRVMGRR